MLLVLPFRARELGEIDLLQATATFAAVEMRHDQK